MTTAIDEKYDYTDDSVYFIRVRIARLIERSHRVAREMKTAFIFNDANSLNYLARIKQLENLIFREFISWIAKAETNVFEILKISNELQEIYSFLKGNLLYDYNFKSKAKLQNEIELLKESINDFKNRDIPQGIKIILKIIKKFKENMSYLKLANSELSFNQETVSIKASNFISDPSSNYKDFLLFIKKSIYEFEKSYNLKDKDETLKLKELFDELEMELILGNFDRFKVDAS